MIYAIEAAPNRNALYVVTEGEGLLVYDLQAMKKNALVDLASFRAVYDCFAYGQRSWNHPRMSCGVTWFSTFPIASITPSTVLAASERKPSLILENISSIGVKSGL